MYIYTHVCTYIYIHRHIHTIPYTYLQSVKRRSADLRVPYKARKTSITPSQPVENITVAQEWEKSMNTAMSSDRSRNFVIDLDVLQVLGCRVETRSYLLDGMFRATRKVGFGSLSERMLLDGLKQAMQT